MNIAALLRYEAFFSLLYLNREIRVSVINVFKNASAVAAKLIKKIPGIVKNIKNKLVPLKFLSCCFTNEVKLKAQTKAARKDGIRKANSFIPKMLIESA